MRNNTPFSSNTGLGQRGHTHGNRSYLERRKSAPTPIKWDTDEDPTISIINSVEIGVFEKDIIKTVGIDNPGKLPWFVVEYFAASDIAIREPGTWAQRRCIVTRLQDWYFPLYPTGSGLTVRTHPAEVRTAKAISLTIGDKKMIERAVGRLLGVTPPEIGNP